MHILLAEQTGAFSRARPERFLVLRLTPYGCDAIVHMPRDSTFELVRRPRWLDGRRLRIFPLSALFLPVPATCGGSERQACESCIGEQIQAGVALSDRMSVGTVNCLAWAPSAVRLVRLWRGGWPAPSHVRFGVSSPLYRHIRLHDDSFVSTPMELRGIGSSMYTRQEIAHLADISFVDSVRNQWVLLISTGFQILPRDTIPLRLHLAVGRFH